MIVKRALFDKLARLPEWIEFRDDFQAATGFQLRLVDHLGRPPSAETDAKPALCRYMTEQKNGSMVCAKFQQRLLLSAEAKPARSLCDAGLNEVAVPIHVGGSTTGFFIFGGFRDPSPPEVVLSRARHLLEKAGVSLDPKTLRAALEEARQAEPRAVEGLVRFVQMAVRLIAERLTHHVTAVGSEEAPKAVRRACTLIRQEALLGAVKLSDVARRCGVSEGHLSRSFHHSIGLTFSEFVARFRAEHARDLLADRSRNITEIAQLSGFGSLSQFHRTFRRIFGLAPTAFRKAALARLREFSRR